MTDTKLKPRHDIKFQWGDPPKPNIWKVEQEEKLFGHIVMDKTLRVSSPLIKGYIRIVYDPKVRASACSGYIEDDYADVISLKPKNYPLMPLSEITSHEFYKAYVEPKIFDGRIKLTREGSKVASSGGLKAMWGDPPKPNLWKVNIGSWGKGKEYVEVTSPLLGKDTNITLTKMFHNLHAWEISFNPPFEERSLTTFSSGTFEAARDAFLGEFGWQVIKDGIKKGEVFLAASNLKVAATVSNHKAMWGDPPKPNLWEVREHNHNSYNDYVAVKSPLLKDDGEFFVVRRRDKEGWEMCYHSRFQAMRKIITYDEMSFEEIRELFLSRETWLDIKIWLSQSQRDIFTVPKVASSKKVANDWIAPKVDIKLQWGDPPKPNLWRVTENMFLTGRGEKGYHITSPVMVGSIFLTFKQDSYSKLEYMERGEQVKHLKFLDKSSLETSLELIKSPMFWRNVIKRAIEKGTINLTVPKVASIASPNKKKVELQWGDPPKPNIWKVDVNDYGNWAITSPLMVGVIVYYLETGAVIYHGAPGRADVRLHAFDINAPLHKIEHLLKSTAFWRKVEPHVHLRGKVASSNGLKVAYLYRKGQGFPSSINTHLINLLAQPQRGSRQKPKDPADFKLSIRGLSVHNGEWCLEFNYSYKGAKEVRGGVFLERLDSKYDGGQGSPTKQEVVDACLKATRGMMTFDYHR